MDWRDQATQEKSLFEVYWKAKKVASSKTNLYAAVLFGLLFFSAIYADRRFGFGVFGLNELSEIINQISELGFAFTTAILGFLIAGFSIFASITKPEIFKGLAQLPHKNTDLTRLKFIFFNFLFVFIHYLAFLAVCLFIQIVLPAIKEAFGILKSQGIISDGFIWWYATLNVVIFSGWLLFLVMLLKSFIWNIYQSVLLIIVTGDLLSKLVGDKEEK